MNKLTALVIAVLVYSLMGFAYTHSTFASKDVLEMIVKRLDRIDKKIDDLIKKNTNY